jgi:bifunctional non-homologous end joining protein LigD
MPRLREYERKRDRKQTPEPFGGKRKKGKQPIFVVQRHQARALHYDFRLERDGALASWAVPKGVPLDVGERHLAVHVEDHPLEYATFAGEIPKGQYGAGTVEIWDSGTYELVEEKPDGGLTVRLNGKRLDGLWTLIPAHLSGQEKNWLIVRKREEAAAPPPEGGKTRYAPMLATLAEQLPTGRDWRFEVKWDGFRTIAYLRGSEPELRSRKDQDLTERFAAVARELPKAIRTPHCVLDGEVCALDDEGRPTFSGLQQGDRPLAYYIFDLLELDGTPIVDRPLRERHEQLEEILDRRNKIVKLSEMFDDGPGLERVVLERRFEGVMAKKLGSTYEPGKRSRNWLKVKPKQGLQRQEFVIAGYTKGEGRRASSFGALVLAVREGAKLRWVGNVGTGFDEREIQRLLKLLKPLARKTPPLDPVPKMPRVKKGDVVWIEPKLVAQVAFTEWTHDDRLRAPRYEGLREDKEVEEVTRERPMETEIRRGKRVLRLTNLDKVFFPDDGITKGDLLAYYRDVAEFVLPHIRKRPFTMKRFPDGIEGGHFFQKDAPKHMPEWIPKVEYRSTSRATREKRTIAYPLVNDDLGLLWMVNMGCIDLNTWYSRVDKPDRPDFCLFDLDPSEGVGFAECVEVALRIKELLDTLGLEGYPKTSGSDGIHVLVPVTRRHTYADTRHFAEIVAGTLARLHPKLVTTEWSKAKRRGVLVDANQNGEGKTIASVYSVRPHPGAPVSTPLRWDEVVEGLDPRDFTMDVVLDRVRRDGDIFAPVLEGKQSLRDALEALST